MTSRDKIFFDGGCRPNPGPIVTCIVHRGQAIIRRDHGVGDSCMAEWTALIEAARHAMTLPGQDLLLIGDSATVLAQARGDQRIGSPDLAALAAEYRAIIHDRSDLHLRWIRRGQNLAGIALERDRWRMPV